MSIPTHTVGRRLTIAAAEADELSAVVEPLFREYGEWIAAWLAQDAGITYTEADLERHHDAFRGELPRLLGPRGRLVVARLDSTPVGVGALKPIDETIAEVKRMYVRPETRGAGVGRAILGGLLEDARAEQYRTARLETLRFMTTALALYRSFGFVETPPFDGSEVANTPIAPITIFLELALDVDR
jgi:GNAT superfamily N-acetyltransferase